MTWGRIGQGGGRGHDDVRGGDSRHPGDGPGEAFEYTSACPLTTPFGSMRGTYQMVTDAGERFDAEIARFTLAEPHSIH